MKGYIYKYTFSDGKVYIGQTRRPPAIRNMEHFSKIIGKTNPNFWEAYNKLGKPNYEIVETIESARVQDLVERLNELETKYITDYDASNPEHGYNIRNHANVAIPRDAVLDKEFDRIWLSKAEQWYPIYWSVKEKLFKTYESLTEDELSFCKDLLNDDTQVFSDSAKKQNFDFNDLKSNSDIARFFMSELLIGAEFLFRNSSWDQIRQYIKDNKEQILAENKPEPYIVQMYKDGSIVCEYASRAEIKEKMHLTNLTNIFNCIEGKQKSAYGYKWCYKKDYKKNENQQLSFDF